MRRLVLVSLAAGLLAGCALPVERPGRQELWAVSAGAGEAKLAFGVPESEQVRLMMTCRPHSGEVLITVVGLRGDPAAFELHSGETWARYAGAGAEDEETEGAFDIEVKAAVTDPVLSRLADTGKLTVVFPTRRIVLPNAFSQAHDFLNVCRPL
jgi:hypothetical protein